MDPMEMKLTEGPVGSLLTEMDGKTTNSYYSRKWIITKPHDKKI